MTRTVLWQWRRRVRKLVPSRLVKAGAKLCEGRNAGSAWVLRQIIIGIYGVLLRGSPIISTWHPTLASIDCLLETMLVVARVESKGRLILTGKWGCAACTNRRQARVCKARMPRFQMVPIGLPGIRVS